MNQSSFNILNRDILDFDDNDDNKEKSKDSYANNSEKWAFRVDLDIKNNIDEDKKNKSIKESIKNDNEDGKINKDKKEEKKEIEKAIEVHVEKEDNLLYNDFEVNKEEIENNKNKEENNDIKVFDKKSDKTEKNNKIGLFGQNKNDDEKEKEKEININDDLNDNKNKIMNNKLKSMEDILEDKGKTTDDRNDTKELVYEIEDKKEIKNENINNENKIKENMKNNNRDLLSHKNKEIIEEDKNNVLIIENNKKEKKDNNQLKLGGAKKEEEHVEKSNQSLIDDNQESIKDVYDDLLIDDNNDLLINGNKEEIKRDNNNEKKDNNNEIKEIDKKQEIKENNNKEETKIIKEISKIIIKEKKGKIKEDKKEEINNNLKEDKKEKINENIKEDKKEENDKKENKKKQKNVKIQEDIIKNIKKEEEEIKKIRNEKKPHTIKINSRIDINQKNEIEKLARYRTKKKEIDLGNNNNYSSDNNLMINTSHRRLNPNKYHRKNLLIGINKSGLNLDEIGKIENAKKHSSANSILKQVAVFNQNTEFCPCCCLPCKKKGVLENFSYCDNTDDFINLGEGTTLYFSFFKYSMMIISIAALVIGLPFLIFSFQYTDSLQRLCNYYYNLNETNDLMGTCMLYITEEAYASLNYSIVDSPFFLFSSVNIKDYRKIIKRMYDTNHNENSILSFPLLSLICSITLLIINMLYTILIYNKSTNYDYQLTSPSDFTVKLSNLQEVLSHYLSIRQKYDEMKEKEPNKLNKDGSPFDFEKHLREELGINEEDIEKIYGKKLKKGKKHISKLKEFSAFVGKKICVGKKDEKYNIEQVNICFKLNKFMELEDNLQLKNTQIVKIKNHPYQIEKNKKLNLKEEHRRYFGSILSGYNLFWFNCYDEGIELSQLEDEKNIIEDKIKDLFKKSEDIDENNFSGVAFITFNTIKEQEKYLSQFPTNIFSYFLKIVMNLRYIFCCCFTKKDIKRNLDAVVAPEPEDVIYENLEYSYKEILFRTIIVYIISIVLILICLGIFIGLNLLQKYVNNKAIHIILNYIISLCNTCVSSCLNIIFQMILDFLTKKEKVHTMTQYYRSYSVKLTLFTFFTSAVVPLICELINKSEGYEILISNMLMMFLVNAFVTPIMWTINFTYFLKQFQICLIESKENPDKKHNMTQRELNDLYELPSMSISYKYSYIAKTILMTFLYIPIFPLGIIISLCGFVFGYLLEKFNFAYMYKRPEMLNHKLCSFYVNHFDVIIFVFSIGDYIFMSDTYENKTLPLVKIIIFGIVTIIPYSKLLRLDFIGIQESKLKSEKFKDKYFTFSTDYERSNPMSRKKGIKHYLLKLLESKRINREKYEELKLNAESLNLMQVYYENRKNKNIFDTQKTFARAVGRKFLNVKNIVNNDSNNNNINIIINNDNNNIDNNNDNNNIDNNNDNNNIDNNNIDNSNYNNNYNNNNFNNNILFVDLQPGINENNEGLKVKEESVEKEEEKNNIAEFYNNPFFIGYGCTIQSYVKQVLEKSEKSINEDINEDNMMVIKENKKEEEKEDILIEDKIK